MFEINKFKFVIKSSYLIFFTIYFFLFYFFQIFASSIDLESSGSTSETGTTSNISVVEIPEFKYTFQNPTYLIDKETEKSEYFCDSEKEDCKVNFKLTTLDDKDISSKFACFIDFGFITGEENKCNPNTVTFLPQEYNIKFRVFENDNLSNFKEKNLKIINNKQENAVGSGSVETGTGATQTSSGSVETGSGITSSGSSDSGTGLEVPNVEIEVQSGLEYSGNSNLWNCKNEDCKVNLTAENSFTGIYEEKNYSCLWDFGSGSFETVDTDKKCNPGFVNYSTGNFLINLKIYDKNNELNFKTGAIFISNLSNENKVSTGTIETSSGSSDFSSGSVETGSILEIPNVEIEVQSGLEYSGSGNLWNCKNEDCKVNLTVENSFTGIYEEKNYSCFWDFGSGSFETVDTDKKCNPGFVSFGSGTFLITLRVHEKNNEVNFKTGALNIVNFIKIKSNSGGGGSASSNSSDSIPTRSLDIQVQSGLEKDSSGYFCLEERCKINFKYDSVYGETCTWNFSDGEFREEYINTCNPSFVYFLGGVHNVYLEVRKNGEIVNSRSITFNNNFLNVAKINNRPPLAKIVLQGTLAKYKTLEGNKITCNEVEECSINLSGIDTIDPDNDNLDFFWDFGNGEISNKINPGSIKYKPGNYKIILKVSDKFGEISYDYFFVEVKSNSILEENLKIDNNIFTYLKIKEVLVNPSGNDDNEYIKIENTGEKILNLKGVILDDEIGKGSKEYVITNDLFLLPYGSITFKKNKTDISLTNSFDEVNIIYNKILVDSLKWDFSVPENYLLTHNSLDYYREKVFVVRVIDGDTIVIRFSDSKEEKLRFIGVDTPETVHPRKELEFFGKEASNFTKSILEGKDIIVEFDRNNYRDKYARLLGYVYIDDNVNFNKMLIEKGYSRVYLRYPFKYSKEFEEAQNKAKKEEIGIWSNKDLKKELLLEIKKEKEILDQILSDNLKNSIFELAFSFDTKDFSGQLSELLISFDDKIKPIYLNSYNFGNKLISWDFKIDKKNNKNIVNVDLNKIKFSQNIKKQKKSLRIDGKTIANAKVVISFGDNNFETFSNSSGSYSFNLTGLEVGKFNLKSKVYNELGEEFLISKEKELELTSSYLNEMKLASTPKVKVKKTKKLAKNTISKPKNLFFEVANAKNEKQEINLENNKNTFFILNILISIIIVFFGFIVIRKHKI